MREIRSAALRYPLALGSFVLILLISYGLQHLFSLKLDLTWLIIAAMIASAWYLGRGPGLLYALVFELMLDYFSTAPLTFKSSVVIFNRLLLFVSLVLFASSRRKAEKNLREQREWLQVTLSSIGDAVIATDITGRINFINPIAESLTGWTMALAAGQPLDTIFRIVNEETRAPVESPFAIIKREGIIVGLANHTILLTRDGREIPIEDSGAPIRDTDGHTIGVIVVFHDVSERRRAEQEREKLLKLEQSARNDAEIANRMKDEFLATVSHELRTPLTSILGWAAVLNHGGLEPETIRMALGVIERNAKSQAMIIDDILDVSRIITGKLHIDAQAIELGQIMRAAIETLRPAAAAKDITLDISLPETESLIAGDRDRLQQIIWNLVSNAIKFTPKGGRVEVRLAQVDSHLEVSVRDNGIGINREFLPYVFERFRQADSSMTRAHGGLGLGLAIVRHLVELHGGTVAAESEGTGLGASFTMRLPLREAGQAGTLSKSEPEHEAKRAEETGGTGSEPADLKGLRVLVVDDEPDALEAVCMILKQHGAMVRAAASCADALEALGEWRPDVLVSDLGMPGENGFTLIGKVRALVPEQGGDIPAAALTAYVREEERQRALDAGYQTHIPKPIDPSTLAVAVAKLAKGVRRNQVR